jgi:hypothetical protein
VSERDALSPTDRLAAIGDRLATLREQTAALSARAGDAATRSREVRAATPTGCDHRAQAEQMQAALDVLEHELDGLRTAMLTRGVIEQAKGMLMLRRGCDADEAFNVLVELSQTSHRKLVVVAEALVREFSAGGHAES